LISLFDAVSSAAVTLAALGVQLCLATVGASRLFQKVPAQLFSHVLQFHDVCGFSFAHLPRVWQVAPYWMILFIMGRRCAGHMQHVNRIAREAADTVGTQQRILALFETSQCPDHLLQPELSQELLVGPFQSQASDLGYVARSGFWRVCSGDVSLQRAVLQASIDIVVVQVVPQGQDSIVLKFIGKPCPRDLFLADGYSRSSADFFAPFDLQENSSSALLQKGASQRDPTTNEHAQMFCIPASVLAAAGSDLDREDELLSWAVADSFHIPKSCSRVARSSALSLQMPVTS
jgi:hypothetical protein